MKKNIFILSTSLLLVSCQQNQQTVTEESGNTTDSVTAANNSKNKINLQIGEFTEVDSSGILMLPLTADESKKYSSRSSYKEIPYYGCWNIIFYNGNSNEYHLLSNKKILIMGRDLITTTSDFIFYTATSYDYNNDKRLTNDDPLYLFVSDKEGYNFRQISPDGYDLHTWKYVKSLKKVILTAKKDSDKNKKFDEEDEVMAFEVVINQESTPREILSDDFKKELKNLFDKDWKRINQ